MLNFKRLFREYGFDRDVNKDGDLEWHHPWFVRGRREMVRQIKTRRKAFGNALPDPSNEGLFGPPVVIPTEGKRRYSVRRRKKTKRFSNGSDVSFNSSMGTPDHGGGGDVSLNGSIDGKAFVVKPPQAIYIENGTPDLHRSRSQHSIHMTHSGGKLVNEKVSAQIDHDVQAVMNDFARNEFTIEEYNEYISKKRKLEQQMKVDSNKSGIDVTQKEFWWMYENRSNQNPQNVEPLSSDVTSTQFVKDPNQNTNAGNVPDSMPCGFCKCCSAISSYVHVFGEIPENIQVIDYLEEESVPAQPVATAPDAADVTAPSMQVRGSSCPEDLHDSTESAQLTQIKDLAALSEERSKIEAASILCHQLPMSKSLSVV